MDVALEDRTVSSGSARRGTLSLPYKLFNLAAARSIVWPWLGRCLVSTISGRGAERRIHHVRPAVTHGGGVSVEGGITIGVGRVENRAAGEAIEVSAL